jgi:hypothetical protein
MATKKKPAPVDFASAYGVQAALVNSNPELKALFDSAVTGKWTPAKFNAAFTNTSWYKTHSDTWRTAEAARTTDPASWTEQLNATKELIKQTATGLGFALGDSEIESLASQSLYLAGGSSSRVDPSILKKHVAETGRITGQGGTALQTMDSLKTAAYANGVQYNDDWFSNAAKNILTGDGTVEAWNKQIKDAAKSKYAALAPQLDAGMSVMDVASPYMQQMAATFELDPAVMTLDDPLMQKALTNLDKESKPSLKPLWQFQQELKQDDRYFKTNKAHQDMTGLATEIARQFGKA